MSGKDTQKTDRRSMLKEVNDGHNVFSDESSASSDRRPLLKGIGVSLASALGLGGTAAASGGKESEMHEKTEAAIDGYDTPGAVKSALAEHENGLLDSVAGSSFLGAVSLSSFESDTVNVQKAPAESDPDEGTYVTASEHDGEYTAHISIVRKTPNAVVRLNVQPQLDRSFATVRTRDGETIAVIDPSNEKSISAQSTDGSDDDVSIQKVCGSDGYTCPPGACCTFCGTKQVKHERTCCQYADGTIDCYEEPIDKCCDPLVCC